jgi:hypothetical protein
LFLLKLISKKEGKLNTIQHDQGEKHRRRGKTIDAGGKH